MKKSNLSWSPFKELDAKENKPWKKERWYSGDVNGCMGGAYYSRLGMEPTNPADARGQRIMRMGKQMEILLVNDIKRNYMKEMPLTRILNTGYLFPKLKEVFWNAEIFQRIKDLWYDKDSSTLDKFYKGLELFEEGWEKVCFNGYTDPDIERIETQRYIRDEKLDVGLRIDLLIICKPNTKPSIIYEIKSVNSRAFWWMAQSPKGFQPKEDHVKQTHLYLYELKDEIPGIQARVLYVARDDMSTQECDILYNDKHAKEQVKKFALLNKCWKEKKVPPIEPAIIFEHGKYIVNWKAKYCSHHALCMNDPDWLKKAEAEVLELNTKNNLIKPIKRSTRKTSKIKK